MELIYSVEFTQPPHYNIFWVNPLSVPKPSSIFCQPGEVLDDFEHDGFVERSRRAIAGGKHSRGSTGREEIRPGVPTYTLENLGGAPCIKAQTDCLFKLEYQVKETQYFNFARLRFIVARKSFHLVHD